MAVLIDTNIAIFLADGSVDVTRRIGTLDDSPVISMVTLVELEGGVVIKPELARLRRQRLDAFLSEIAVLALDVEVVRAYGAIVATLGFSRGRVLDRLIAATALMHDLTVVTTNGPDFAAIPGLKLEVWPRPAQ